MAIKWMLRATSVLVILAMVQTATLSATRAASDLYTGLTLIDPVKETRTADSYVLVTDGRIAAIGAGAPPTSLKAVRIHDFSGRYALPGFIDAHAHITAGPQRFKCVPERR